MIIWLKNSSFLEHSCSMSGSQAALWGTGAESGGRACVCGGEVTILTIYFAGRSTPAGPTLGNADKQFFGNDDFV